MIHQTLLRFKLTTLIATTAFFALACRELPDVVPPASYNVVIMLIDTLRADRLGIYGYPVDTSPHIDQLATEAVVFERVHAPAPWTLPSVTSLMLSRPLCEHNVLLDRQKIHDSAHTLADRLREAGYSTGAFFKNPYAGELSGLDRGFEVSELVEGQLDIERVGEWLDTRADQPFFLYLHTMAPHDPGGAKRRHLKALGYKVPRRTIVEVRKLVNRYRELTRVDFVNRRPLGTTDNTAEQRQAMQQLSQLGDTISQLYDAQVRADDRRVGSMLSELRRRGVWDDTLFILLSDHGEEMDEHGGWQHDQSVYEELIRVPLVMKLPDALYGGQRIAEPITLIDVLPTIMEIVGRDDLAIEARGESLVPLLRPNSARPSRARVTSMRNNQKKHFQPFAEARGNINVVIVDGQWKGIYNVELGSFELYDLVSDPAESRDLSSTKPQRSRFMLSAAISSYQDCISRQRERSTPLGEMDEKQEEVLRSLGYIQ